MKAELADTGMVAQPNRKKMPATCHPWVNGATAFMETSGRMADVSGDIGPSRRGQAVEAIVALMASACRKG
ncbi:hypothetical protein IB238_03935 [Rhizobium sp. ARZ01]|uniref:hypothetical protein n=1 Tax=Rhizobium sp. ARZ01 TaxID=2769313 RepID=UPI0017857645|nr:hypothetical protein [Rhizobium sp. ARZ01]MBD9371791.1 hypothetical protein [Rhizobium sp. ARZ01]